MDVQLIRDPRCCADLTGADAFTGATVMHPCPEDGTRHELDVYWRDAPPGRQTVTLLSIDPLHLAEPLICSCGWTENS